MGKRWTFQDRATSMLRQLDYILVRCKWRNSILNAEPYSTFNSVGSDHRVVSMRVRLTQRVPSARYTVEVRNRFQLLGEEEGANAKYKRLIAANVEATRNAGRSRSLTAALRNQVSLKCLDLLVMLLLLSPVTHFCWIYVT
ncbi:hypothetical protein SKAU_G00391870 [Synaphobranchus kaupii]|uniref:Uncharacterized protein n=1 Tax=Synaphobranchus kaupii TaxID=118154 RepID=A0A9Q1EBN0_SYNKA|nr:hypothetical protein SKAU_G00391870 [Synaphobranchus kaupii]